MVAEIRDGTQVNAWIDVALKRANCAFVESARRTAEKSLPLASRQIRPGRQPLPSSVPRLLASAQLPSASGAWHATQSLLPSGSRKYAP